MTLFNLPPLTPGFLPTESEPRLSPDARRTQQNRALLERGTHPATRRPLLEAAWGYHCRDCAHAFRIDHNGRQWWKCDLHRLGPSHSAASDIRVSWPACTLLTIDQREPPA